MIKLEPLAVMIGDKVSILDALGHLLLARTGSPDQSIC